MRKTLVAGNWKLNGSKESVKELVSGLLAGISDVKDTQVTVCPPYVYIPMVAEMLQDSAIAVGSQDNSDQESGAYTGEVAAPMLKEMGCTYAIVGHSERRSLYGEADADTAKKYAAARKAGLTPILCVGELLEERENGTTEEVVARQLDAIIDLEGVEALADGVIAYEPVWAIGTGKTATAGKIAALTGRDILQVDFSQVQSKWVGESEKNMKRIFNEYSIALRNLKKEPILLFNEADSLISRRININDSVDQMNNTLQNILLEELENFEGILIATTNLIDNIDPAFDRRFIYKLKFDKPNKEIRKKIWKNKFPELNDRFVEKLSDYDLSGGQIENIVKKCVITKVLEMKQLELSEIIDYVKEELQFREATKKIVGFKNEE